MRPAYRELPHGREVACWITAVQVLEAHKGQPTIEKRFEQIKTVHEIAPVFLKNSMHIEAFFTLYFLALRTETTSHHET